jgi:hypothetical protein
MSGYIGKAPINAIVGTSSSQIVPANPMRKGIIITNTSDTNKICLAFGSNAAEVEKGVCLYPHGVLSFDQYLYTQESINAISSALGIVVTIQEFE